MLHNHFDPLLIYLRNICWYWLSFNTSVPINMWISGWPLDLFIKEPWQTAGCNCLLFVVVKLTHYSMCVWSSCTCNIIFVSTDEDEDMLPTDQQSIVEHLICTKPLQTRYLHTLQFYVWKKQTTKTWFVRLFLFVSCWKLARTYEEWEICRIQFVKLFVVKFTEVNEHIYSWCQMNQSFL